jgi:hypothetical protein
MRWHRLVVPALVALALVGGSWLSAQQGAGGRPAKKSRDLLKVLAKKLELTEPQMEKLKKISEKYEPQIQRLEAQLLELRNKELGALERICTDDQREQLQELRTRFFPKKGKGQKKEKGG